MCSLLAVDFPLRWRFSNPAPHGNNIVDMAYLPGNPGLWVQVAEQGQIYTSVDLDLWIPRQSGTSNALRAVTFFGPRVVVTGEAGKVLYADDLDHFTPGVLLDGATANWLEAVAASPNMLVTVGDNGALYNSFNGIQWKKQTSGFTNWLAGVAWGNGTFVAVGSAGLIATSANGTNWTKRTSGTTRPLNRVAFGAGRFIAVGDAGVTLNSTNNGLNWFAETSGATNDLENAAATSAARLLVGYDEVRLHENGVWSNELAKSNGPPAWTYYANVARPDFFLIAGQTGMTVEGYKTNATPYFWIPSFQSVRNWLWDVTYAGNLYVAVGDFGTVMTSGDGVNWSLELAPRSVTNSVLLGVGGTTDLLLAVGERGSVIISPNLFTNVTVTNLTFDGPVVTNYPASSLGVIWFEVPSPTTNDLQGVSFFNGLYVITGDKGNVFTSPDGTNWTARATPTTKLLSSVAAWPGGLVAVGDDGALITSPDGIAWTARATGTTNWLYRVRYLGGNLIALGQNGVLLTSTNATNWVARNSGTTKWLNDVTLIDDTYFVVGVSGTVLASANLVNWTNIGTITRKSLYAAATDSRQLVTVGIEGVILRSPVLPDLTPMSFLAYSRFGSTNAPVVHNLFLFGGKADQQFTLDYKSDFTTNRWQMGAQLEFFASDGTLIYLESIPASNAPPLEFYRGSMAK